MMMMLRAEESARRCGMERARAPEEWNGAIEGWAKRDAQESLRASVNVLYISENFKISSSTSTQLRASASKLIIPWHTGTKPPRTREQKSLHLSSRNNFFLLLAHFYIASSYTELLWFCLFSSPLHPQHFFFPFYCVHTLPVCRHIPCLPSSLSLDFFLYSLTLVCAAL